MPRHDDDNTPIRRYSKPPNKMLIPFVAGGIGLGVLLLVSVVLLVMVLNRSGNVSAASGAAISTERPPNKAKVEPVDESVKKVVAAFKGVPTVNGEGKSWSLEELCAYLKARGAVVDYEKDGSRMLCKTKKGDTISVNALGGPLAAQNEATRIHGSISSATTNKQFCALWGRFVASAPFVTGGSSVDVFCVLPGAWDYEPHHPPFEIGTWKGDEYIDGLTEASTNGAARLEQDRKRRIADYEQRIRNARGR